MKHNYCTRPSCRCLRPVHGWAAHLWHSRQCPRARSGECHGVAHKSLLCARSPHPRAARRYPVQEACGIIMSAVRSFCSKQAGGVVDVRLVSFDTPTASAFAAAFDAAVAEDTIRVSKEVPFQQASTETKDPSEPHSLAGEQKTADSLTDTSDLVGSHTAPAGTEACRPLAGAMEPAPCGSSDHDCGSSGVPGDGGGTHAAAAGHSDAAATPS